MSLSFWLCLSEIEISARSSREHHRSSCLSCERSLPPPSVAVDVLYARLDSRFTRGTRVSFLYFASNVSGRVPRGGRSSHNRAVIPPPCVRAPAPTSQLPAPTSHLPPTIHPPLTCLSALRMIELPPCRHFFPHLPHLPHPGPGRFRSSLAHGSLRHDERLEPDACGTRFDAPSCMPLLRFRSSNSQRREERGETRDERREPRRKTGQTRLGSDVVLATHRAAVRPV